MAIANGKAANGKVKRFTSKDYTDFVHVGPGTLAGQYLRRFWHPVFVSDDLPAGRAVPVKLLGEDFTLYRGESGEVHAVDFRCAHRLTQLNTGWIEGENIRCRYHGWVYDGNGQCVEQPAEPRPFCEKVKVRAFPAYDYLGLVFVHLGQGDPPPKPHYPDFEIEGVRRNSIHLRLCSFFNNLENSCDEVHLSFTHKGAFGEYMETLPEEIWGQETDYGIARYGRRPGGNVRVEHIHMPNMQQRGGAPLGPGSGWVGTLAWRVPRDDGSHYIASVTMSQPVDGGNGPRRGEPGTERGVETRDTLEVAAEILAGKLTIEDVLHLRNVGVIQDEVTQSGQGPLGHRELERLGYSDKVIVLLRSIWTRELKALADGKPLKEWKRSRELEQASIEWV